MKKTFIVLLLYGFAINVAYSEVGKFESFGNGMSRSQYTVCDSVVKRDCINFNTSTNVGSSVSTNSSINSSGKKVVSTDAYTGANDSYFNPNENVYDQNAIANFNITNSNQTLMQAYSVELSPEFSPSTFIRDKVSIPVKTTENSSLNVGANKIEFKLSY